MEQRDDKRKEIQMGTRVIILATNEVGTIENCYSYRQQNTYLVSVDGKEMEYCENDIEIIDDNIEEV